LEISLKKRNVFYEQKKQKSNIYYEGHNQRRKRQNLILLSNSTVDNLIGKLINRTKKTSTKQLIKIANQVALAPFTEDLLAGDELLWGGFWQGDGIAPGYRLPAVELALLRALRLDGAWPEGTTAPQFLADLRRAIRHPRAGIWTLSAAGQPCVVFAAPEENRIWITVVWYCASTGRLHAGYRTTPGGFHLKGALKQRGPESDSQLKPTVKGKRYDWLAHAVRQIELDEPHSLAARLDVEIP